MTYRDIVHRIVRRKAHFNTRSIWSQRRGIFHFAFQSNLRHVRMIWGRWLNSWIPGQLLLFDKSRWLKFQTTRVCPQRWSSKVDCDPSTEKGVPVQRFIHVPSDSVSNAQTRRQGTREKSFSQACLRLRRFQAPCPCPPFWGHRFIENSNLYGPEPVEIYRRPQKWP